METGVRSHETASLNVAMPTAVPEHMQDGMRELLSVFTPKADRRKGYATALLRVVCEEADAARKVLLITVTDDDLRAWYQRFGFQALPSAAGGPLLMARRVRLAQPIAAPVIANSALPPELEAAQRRIGEMRKAGLPLQQAVRIALNEAARRVH